MRVGIDFRVFQVGHQFRGIGQVASQALRQLDARLDPGDEMVLFTDEDGPDVGDLPAALFTPGRPRRLLTYLNPRYPRLAKLRGPLTDAREQLLARHCDVFVQFDFMLGLPASVPSVVVFYDQIPLLLGDIYPQNYRPHFAAARRAGMPTRQAVYKAATRVIYERMLTAALIRARGIITISEHTATTTRSFARSHGVTGIDDKIHVAHLGHHTDSDDAADEPGPMDRYRIHGLGLDATPFVFFMGGTDERRRIDDLVAAFNDLRARGRNLKLVLAGYDFSSFEAVLSETTRRALMESSYRDDIHLLGYVDDRTRGWLYAHAEAFVFPSLHEGFGLPVIESLSRGCPVVTYDNTSISEVVGPNCVMVPSNWQRLSDGIATIMDRPRSVKESEQTAGRDWAARFTWDAIGSTMYDLVTASTHS